nr:PAS domain S-box protein [Acidobacteriota bacterium]
MNSTSDIETLPAAKTPVVFRWLSRAPAWCAAVVFSIGFLVLAGWTFEIDFLKRIIPGYVWMNPATATAFVLSGIALRLVQSADERRNRIAKVCAVLVLLAGLIKLCELLGFFDFGLDRILFGEHLFDPITGKPNRMAPNTALNFFLAGAALLLFNYKTKRADSFPAQYPAILVILTAFVAVVGYFYGANTFYLVVSFNPMAIHTAVSFLLLSVGLLLSKPGQGIIKDVFSPDIGGQAARRLFPLVVATPLILGWLRLLGEKKGVYGAEMGTSILVVVLIVVLGATVIYNARLINEAANKLGQTENALSDSDELVRLLSKSEESYRQLADAMPQIVWTAQPDGFLDYYNERWFDYTGMTLEQTQGWGWEPVLHPDDLQNCVERWSRAVETGEKYKVEYRFKRASDGEHRWHLGQALPIRDAENQVVKWFGTCTDIHEQKKVEEELREIQEQLELRVESRTADIERANRELTEEIAERKRFEEKLIQLSSIVESSDDAIVSKNLDGIIVSWNKGAERLYGYAAEEIIGKNISLLLPPGREDEETQIIERIKSGESVEHFETVRLRKDGSLPDLSITISPIKNAAGEITGAAKIARDITERKRAEEELKNFAERLK